MIILDTDHCIDILRGRQEVIVARCSVYEEVATTIITAPGQTSTSEPPSRPSLWRTSAPWMLSCARCE